MIILYYTSLTGCKSVKSKRAQQYVSLHSTLTNTYAIGLGLWPIYAACLIEQSLIMTLTFMKYKYEKEDACAKQISKLSSTSKASEEEEDEKADYDVAVDVEAANDSSSSSLPQSVGLKNEGDKRRQLMNSMGRSSRLGMSTSWLREVLDESPNENAALENGDKRSQLLNSMGRSGSGGGLGTSTSWFREVIVEELSEDDDDKEANEAAVNNDVKAANNESSGSVSLSSGHKNDGDKRRQFLMNSMGKSSRLGVSTLWLNAIKDEGGRGEGETAENSGVKRTQLMNSMGKSSPLGVSTLWLNAIKDSGGGEGEDATVENSGVKRRQLLNSTGESSRLGLNAINDSEEEDSTSKGLEEMCAADA